METKTKQKLNEAILNDIELQELLKKRLVCLLNLQPIRIVDEDNNIVSEIMSHQDNELLIKVDAMIQLRINQIKNCFKE